MFLSIFCYAIGVAIQQKTGSPLCNPLLIASVLVGVLLIVSGTTYQTYEESGQLISFFLTPATVALAIPIYRKLDVLLHNLLPILLGAFVGSCVSIGSVLLFCHLFGLSDSTTRSLIPKSVTTPIGVALADMMGGVTSITAIAIVITGIFGAILLPTFLAASACAIRCRWDCPSARRRKRYPLLRLPNFSLSRVSLRSRLKRGESTDLPLRSLFFILP